MSVHNIHSLKHMMVWEGGGNTQYKATSNTHARFEDIIISNLQPHALMVYDFKDTRPYRNVTNWQLKNKTNDS